MQSNEIVKAILRDRKISVLQFARTLGKVQQNIDYQLKNDIHCAKLVEYCGMFGYEVVVQPKSSGKRKDGSYVLTLEKGEE